jgi:hypothetical protein
MDEVLEQHLQELWDRQEIIDCLLRYSRGLDRLDIDLYRSAWAPGGLDNHAAAVSPAEFLTAWLPGQEARETTQHAVTNFAVDIDGDEAHVESYYLVSIKYHGQDEIILHGGRYADRLTKVDGKWLIAVRVVLPEWHSVQPAVANSPDVLRTSWRRRSAEDPTYERPLMPRYDVSDNPRR